MNNIVAGDVYRVTEQVHYRTRKLEELKHRKPGEFREVPLPRSIRESIERFVEKHGTTEDGYVYRHLMPTSIGRAARLLDRGVHDLAA
ncbi:hypothetical protein [Streptomyces tsukubensis]|uniref:Uncharacterized protein n=1 Tax=Streptomyces tsukubensis TaxID=83656 RepID=A0A1V4A0B1_9ACTN|nr:hypothetical protein [Streptomyces tsukubensis]OON72152.1 hypothetical protein B1H18_30600 [Streptomyces tsukubensis]QFR97110.1 hypothetical protein GBW32_33685 [Streptomyces tsukubensis]